MKNLVFHNGNKDNLRIDIVDHLFRLFRLKMVAEGNDL